VQCLYPASTCRPEQPTTSLLQLPTVATQSHAACAAVQTELGEFAPAESWYSLAAIKSFGPWGSTPSCNCKWSSDPSDYSCKPTGRWPEGMCSLKKLANHAKPDYWSTNAGEHRWRCTCSSYVSGTAPLGAHTVLVSSYMCCQQAQCADLVRMCLQLTGTTAVADTCLVYVRSSVCCRLGGQLSYQ
jgi:hypothetical protein